VELEVDLGVRLLDACEERGIPMDAACGGFAACNTCRVRVLKGQLSPMEDVEEPFLDRADQRLACQAHVCGDVLLDLDPGS
jgi:ferredoxin